jgi:hypothetical protein
MKVLDIGAGGTPVITPKGGMAAVTGLGVSSNKATFGWWPSN